MVDPSFQNLQYFLWRFGPEEPLKLYFFNIYLGSLHTIFAYKCNLAIRLFKHGGL